MPKEFEIHQQVELSATPEQVWEVISTTDGLAAWFMPMPIDPDDGSVAAWEPGRRLRIEVPVGEGPAMAFEYLIEARDGGSTVLRFVHSGFTDDDWGDEFVHGTTFGWEMYFALMAEYFVHFAGRRATYVEAEAPPTSASAEAWTSMLAAISPALLAEGDPVTLALPGVEQPVSGTIDYVATHYLGIRTADAIVRFHGRWPMGMSIAVGHHAYSPVDSDALTAGWTGWLAANTG